MAEMDPGVIERSERPKVNLLTYSLIRIVRKGFHFGCEITNDFKVVLGENSSKERIKIEPLVGGASESPIVEVEAVNVGLGLQESSKKAETAFRRFRAPRRSNGGGMKAI